VELRTEVEILAPPERVWDVLQDFHSYPEWNPFITHISGALKVGEQLSVTMSPPDANHFNFAPVLVACDAGKELRWRGKYIHRRLFEGEHFFQLQRTEGGSTRLIHGENFSGFLLKYLKPLLTKTARGFVYMNQALKRRVED